MQLFDAPDILNYGKMSKQAGLEEELVARFCPAGKEAVARDWYADAVIGAAAIQPLSPESLVECRYVQTCWELGKAMTTV